jgi:predicted ArsR family transcriptional regulator
MDELEAVGDPELRATLLYARAQERPVTADDVAAAHDIHRNVARARLERLVDAGLLATGFERRTGRTGPGAGRPAKTYAVPPELDSIEFPVRRYEQLLGLLVDALPPKNRAERLHEVGVTFGRELAHAAQLRPSKSVRAGFDRMCAAVRRLGYQASVEDLTGDRAVLATPTCPLRPLVRAKPEAADIDRGMWAGLAEAALEGVRVGQISCETRDCLENHASCRVLVELHLRNR